MGIVQDYLENKKTKALGLPKLYIVKSTREGVEAICERQVIEITENVSYRYGHRNTIDKTPIDRYSFAPDEAYPFSFDIARGEQSAVDQGFGSGTGDLWSWTYFASFSMEEAEQYHKEESIRVQEKYHPKENLIPKYSERDMIAFGKHCIRQFTLFQNRDEDYTKRLLVDWKPE